MYKDSISPTSSQQQNVILFLILCLVSIKIWLTQGFAISAQNYFYDDRLYLDLSNYLINGEWLGPYSFTTLTKGPGYPLWIALSFFCSIPLLLSQQVFYAFSCSFLAHSLKPLIRWHSFLLLIFAVLLFDPHSYAGRTLRLTREGIYSSLTLCIFACLFGMIANTTASLKKFALWSLALGVSLSFFWITREEGIWILPSCALALLYCCSRIWKHTTLHRYKRLLITLLPFALLSLSIGTLSTINYLNYKVFCIVEFKTAAFKNAFGAMTRVKNDAWLRYVPVPETTRKRIYAVSPTFKKIQPLLEGPVGQKWAAFSTSRLGAEHTRNDIGGGWFQWALRESVAAAGFHSTASDALNFYNAVGNEINAACEAGQLECGPKRATSIVPFRSEHLPYLWEAIVAELKILLSYEQNTPQQVLSNVDVPGYILFTDITLGPVAQPVGEQMPTHNQNHLNSKKIQWLGSISAIYKPLILYFVGAAVLCFIVNVLKALITRRLDPLLVCSLAVLTALSCRLIILAYVEITSFSSTPYLAPEYPLLVLFSFLAFANRVQPQRQRNPRLSVPQKPLHALHSGS